jgi:SAM-dependent methyltransferase
MRYTALLNGVLPASTYNALKTLRNRLRDPREHRRPGAAEINALILPGARTPSVAPDCAFQSSSGSTIPVFDGYRYKMKKTWLNYSGLAVLAELQRLGKLDPVGVETLIELRGTRTLTASIEDIQAIAQRYVDQYPALFLDRKVPRLGKRVLRPTATEVHAAVLRHQRKLCRYFDHLRLLGLPSNAEHMKVLEIGYLSGGESLVAFERLGCEPHGIDYFYAGQFEGVRRWQVVQEITQTKVGFHVGDITKRTQFEDGEFDLIYSDSTIEHISDLQGGFAEMRRLLRPGGLMIHGYGPYFFPLGAHSFGMLDAPWAHLRLNTSDTHRYLRDLRPFESAESIRWIQSSLNPTYTQSFVQKTLSDAGFNTRWWQRYLVDERDLLDLTPEIITDAFEQHPTLSLSELIVNEVIFIAERR